MGKQGRTRGPRAAEVTPGRRNSCQAFLESGVEVTDRPLPLKEEFYYLPTPSEGATWKSAKFRQDAGVRGAGHKPLLWVSTGRARQAGRSSGWGGLESLGGP